MKQCVLCKTRYQKGSGITFHKFPTDIRKLELWLNNIEKSNWHPKKNDWICSKHFSDNSFIKHSSRTTLKKCSVPTIFRNTSIKDIQHNQLCRYYVCAAHFREADIGKHKPYGTVKLVGSAIPFPYDETPPPFENDKKEQTTSYRREPRLDSYFLRKPPNKSEQDFESINSMTFGKLREISPSPIPMQPDDDLEIYVCSPSPLNLEEDAHSSSPDNLEENARSPSPDYDVNMEVKMCRICLQSNSKLLSIESYGLSTAYEKLTGVSVEHDDGLPRELCVECATLLDKYHKFRDKSIRGDQLLRQIYNQNDSAEKLPLEEIDNKIISLASNIDFSGEVTCIDIKPTNLEVPKPIVEPEIVKTELEMTVEQENDVLDNRTENPRQTVDNNRLNDKLESLVNTQDLDFADEMSIKEENIDTDIELDPLKLEFGMKRKREDLLKEQFNIDKVIVVPLQRHQDLKSHVTHLNSHRCKICQKVVPRILALKHREKHLQLQNRATD